MEVAHMAERMDIIWSVSFPITNCGWLLWTSVLSLKYPFEAWDG